MPIEWSINDMVNAGMGTAVGAVIGALVSRWISVMGEKKRMLWEYNRQKVAFLQDRLSSLNTSPYGDQYQMFYFEQHFNEAENIFRSSEGLLKHHKSLDIRDKINMFLANLDNKSIYQQYDKEVQSFNKIRRDYRNQHYNRSDFVGDEETCLSDKDLEHQKIEAELDKIEDDHDKKLSQLAAAGKARLTELTNLVFQCIKAEISDTGRRLM